MFKKNICILGIVALMTAAGATICTTAFSSGKTDENRDKNAGEKRMDAPSQICDFSSDHASTCSAPSKDAMRIRRLERRQRRQWAIAQAMALMAQNSNLNDEKERLQKLVEESKIPEDEKKKINHRNRVINDHVSREAPSIYEQMIGEQESDMEWTSEISTAINDVLKKMNGTATNVNELKCYETLCRAQFAHENRDALFEFRDVASRDAINGPSQGFIEEKEDGTVSSTVYFSRRGDDALLIEEMYDRLYEKVTGHTVDEMAL
ncbi:MAG: hypothetical protein JXR76_01770 [Deltaproteobacteria bacterium]|nr:hypothetical protein [Deltaproteobacteria bacterium]